MKWLWILFVLNEPVGHVGILWKIEPCAARGFSRETVALKFRIDGPSQICDMAQHRFIANPNQEPGSAE
jgi:hypothetical protein